MRALPNNYAYACTKVPIRRIIDKSFAKCDHFNLFKKIQIMNATFLQEQTWSICIAFKTNIQVILQKCFNRKFSFMTNVNSSWNILTVIANSNEMKTCRANRMHDHKQTHTNTQCTHSSDIRRIGQSVPLLDNSHNVYRNAQKYIF